MGNTIRRANDTAPRDLPGSGSAASIDRTKRHNGRNEKLGGRFGAISKHLRGAAYGNRRSGKVVFRTLAGSNWAVSLIATMVEKVRSMKHRHMAAETKPSMSDAGLVKPTFAGKKVDGQLSALAPSTLKALEAAQERIAHIASFIESDPRLLSGCVLDSLRQELASLSKASDKNHGERMAVFHNQLSAAEASIDAMKKLHVLDCEIKALVDTTWNLATFTTVEERTALHDAVAKCKAHRQLPPQDVEDVDVQLRAMVEKIREHRPQTRIFQMTAQCRNPTRFAG